MIRAWMGAVCIAALALTGCVDFGDFGEIGRAKEDFHYSYPLSPGARLDIQNTNGSIDITGWDRNSIDISGTKYASTNDRLRDIQIKVNVSGNSASVVTETPRDFLHGSYGARYVIRVPRQTAVGRGETTNGSITVEDLQGGGHLQSTNGRLSLQRDTGDYEAETTNGSIDLENCNGTERVQTTNGSIRGELTAGSLQAHSTNGTVDVMLRKPADGQHIRASTTNGSVLLTLAELRDNPITAETTHGNVTLRVPGDINADISARTSFSKISCDLALTATEQMSKHELKGRIGKGGPLISAVTTTGSIHLERY
jgi:DUF4097 and DUF4098 domain-containing protein YvlB